MAPSEEQTPEETDPENQVEPSDDNEIDGEGEELTPFETMGREESRQTLYALLFASDRPMSATRLAEAISEDMDPEIVAMMLEELQEEINGKDELPYTVKEIGGGFQLLTKAAYAPYIRRLFQIKKSKRLSKAVLETLAIIAYKQPTTRAEVEAVRGVSVSHAFEQLQERRLIKVSGVADLPGRPKLYKTTEDFLLQFGLGSLKELPTLEELQEVR
jgi:segregation and condensation protein B